MTVGPWSVKGIDPKAREVAKDLARRSGMTLGEWLNQMIIEGDTETSVVAAEPPAPPPPPASFVALAASPAGPRPDLDRIARAVEQLSSRVEAAETRSTLAISGIDQSVNGIAARFAHLERETAAAAQRLEGVVEEVRQAEGASRERLERLAEGDALRGETVSRLEDALRDLQGHISHTARRVDRAEARLEGLGGPPAFEEALARIAARLDGAESSSAEAVRALQSSFAGLEARMARSDDGREGAERRLEALSVALTEKIEASRRELADRLREAAGGRVDQVEARLHDLAAQVQVAERRSAEAIETMGREVLKVASRLGERVRQAETRASLTTQKASEEMNRIAGAIDQRLTAQEAVQAEALQRLGGEIARIAEKLTDRILSADKRAAQAIDDVGDQLGRVTERLNQRFERQDSELGERIRLSEERTAKLLEDAQGRLETRLSEMKRRTVLEATAEAARKAAEADLERAVAQDAAAEPSFPASRHDPAAPGPDPDAAPFGPAPPLAAPNFMTAAPAEPEVAFASMAFEPEVEPPPPFLAPEGGASFHTQETPPFHPAETATREALAPRPPPQGPPSTRDMIEQARAAARRASEPTAPRRGNPGAVDAPPLEADASGFAFPFARKKKKEGVDGKTILLASTTAAALIVTGIGAVNLVKSEVNAANNDRGEPAPTAAPPAAAPEEARRSTDAPPAHPAQGAASDQMAVALSAPPPVETPAPRATEIAPAAALAGDPPAAQKLYSAAVRRIEGGDASGAEDLKHAANLGFAPAEFYLAQLLEKGGAGLPRDLAAARRWTERAAMGGETAAMHNLAMYFYEGEGGPQDTAQALKWFSRAAEGGVRDSQYNLALLYAQGLGAPQNLAEAYKWYLVAAAQGDAGARDAARALRPQLSAETQAAAERAAAAFHARAAGVVRTAMAAPAS